MNKQFLNSANFGPNSAILPVACGGCQNYDASLLPRFHVHGIFAYLMTLNKLLKIANMAFFLRRPDIAPIFSFEKPKKKSSVLLRALRSLGKINDPQCQSVSSYVESERV